MVLLYIFLIFIYLFFVVQLDIFFGPFGILAIANDQLSELTPIYFCLSNYGNGTSTTTTITTSTSTSFCVDETRSSKAPDVSKLVFGSKLSILSDEKLSLKVLVSSVN
ncbi:hypothetical protein AHAS_Ahas20G0195200 [Arachis hypogaea]